MVRRTITFPIGESRSVVCVSRVSSTREGETGVRTPLAIWPTNAPRDQARVFLDAGWGAPWLTGHGTRRGWGRFGDGFGGLRVVWSVLSWRVPELPEVESVRLALEPVMVGRRIVRARLFRRDMLEWDARERGRAEAGMLGGDRVVELKRRGKQMALVGESGRSLVVQLGMSGQVLVLAAGSRSRLDHVHARWVLEDGTVVLFRDPRRFGGLTAIGGGDGLERRWAGLGVDGLVVTGRDLLAALKGTARAIKAALLDQAVVAGVGNIYADESLHAAGIHPLRRGGGLAPAECERLAEEVRRVLAEAIEAGGSTIRDYRGAEGDAGGFQSRHRVYGRGGLACLTCGRTLDSGTIAQRTSVWCAGCQPALRASEGVGFRATRGGDD